MKRTENTNKKKIYKLKNSFKFSVGLFEFYEESEDLENIEL